MAETPAAYPLSWPLGWPRTSPSYRKPSRFTSSRTGGKSERVEIRLVDARERLADELEKLGARSTVLSTNMELRADGQPRASAAAPADPGVAVYFTLKGRPIVLACDRWTTVAGNVAAIAAHIDALRGQDRWGVGSIEQAFAGYAALPPPGPDDWRTILEQPASLEAAEATFRRLIAVAHPDVGGSQEKAAALTNAIAGARKHFRGE